VNRVSQKSVFCVCVLLVFLASAAWAQEATIVGTVTDASGAVVPNAAITTTHIETNQVSHFTTNGDGQYLAPGLQIGRYTVRAEVAGFKKAEHKDLVLTVGDRARVDFKLEVGTAQDSVVVEATPVAIQTENGELTGVISGTQISQLATNGRTLYSLAILTAGASSNMADYQSATPVGGDSNVSFNGLRSSHNIYLIDGGEDLDRGGAGAISVMPSMDAIAEFRQLTSNYSAEYGLSSAGTMTIDFKSGGKTFHASGWEFLRNEDLDANQFFSNASNTPKPLNRLNTYGFNVSGPVYIPKVFNTKKEKTFFFYNMEWRKMKQGGSLNQVVPLANTYTGNVASIGGVHTPCTNQVSAAVATQFAAGGQTLSTPDATGACLGTGLKAFVNNQIPSSLLNANAQILLKAGIFPAPNSGNAFHGGNNAPTNVREEIVRIDHHFTDKFWVFGHFVDEAITQTYGTSMWSGDNVPTASNTFGNPSYSGVVHAVYTVSPTVLDEVAFNYNGNRIAIIPAGLVAQPSGLSVPRLFNGPNALNRIPSIQLGGATGTNYTMNWMPWNNKADDYQIRDDLSWTKGSHQIKAGASWALYKKIQDVFANTEGGFNFNGTYTGSDMGDFLLGYAQNYQEDGVKDSGHWDNQSVALYAQDNWKASQRLTVNLGLRWDSIPHTYEESNRQSNFYPNLYNPANAAVLLPDGSISPSSPGLGTSPNSILQGYKFYLNGIGLAGQNGIPAGLVNNYWGTFGPRVGFAYDLNGQGKTVLRGGVGVMFERIQGNDVYNAGTNVPFSEHVQFNNVSLSNPNLSLLTGATQVAPITVAGITGLSQTDYKAPTSYQYSFGVQHQVSRNTVLAVSYVGNMNRHQNDYRDINNPAPSQLAGLINGTVNYNKVVPYLGFSGIKMSENAMNSHYNGLQMDFHGQIATGLTLQGVYTLAKAMDPINNAGSAGDMTTVSNPYDRTYDNGPSPMDRRHTAVVNFVYQLPFLRGKGTGTVLKDTLGGWEVSGIGTMESGLPLNITLGGSQGSNGLANGTNRPSTQGNYSLPHTLTQWFNPSGFFAPAIGQWGNFPARSVYGPGRDNWNLSLFKSFTFAESRGYHLEIRAETFNIFNHTQFKDVSSTFTDGRFGQVTGTYLPRNVQLGVKLLF
jgi:hypothetical protein